MAYLSASLNICIPRMGEGEAGADAGEGSGLWMYRSDDAPATVIAAGYLDDGDDKGMRVGDGVLVVDNGASMTSHVVTVVDAVGDVTLSAHVVV